MRINTFLIAILALATTASFGGAIDGGRSLAPSKPDQVQILNVSMPSAYLECLQQEAWGELSEFINTEIRGGFIGTHLSETDASDCVREKAIIAAEKQEPTFLCKSASCLMEAAAFYAVSKCYKKSDGSLDQWFPIWARSAIRHCRSFRE